jgi:hypothetical protein
MYWATFWANFFTYSSGHPASDNLSSGVFKRFVDFISFAQTFFRQVESLPLLLLPKAPTYVECIYTNKTRKRASRWGKKFLIQHWRDLDLWQLQLQLQLPEVSS